jgi:hypothetical protein
VSYRVRGVFISSSKSVELLWQAGIPITPALINTTYGYVVTAAGALLTTAYYTLIKHGVIPKGPVDMH